MAKQERRAVSFQDDDLIAGGLANDFDGQLVSMRFGPWNYGGNIDHDVLAVRYKIKPVDPTIAGVEKDGYVYAYHSTGAELTDFMPSQDGIEPVDVNGNGEELFGPCLVPVGSKAGLASGSNFIAGMKAWKECGGPKYTDDLSVFDGIFGHWTRVAQPNRASSGVKVERLDKKGRQKSNDMLVIQAIKDAPKGAAGGGKSAGSSKSSAAAASADTNGADDVEVSDKLRALIAREVAKADGESVGMSVISDVIVQKWKGKERAVAVRLLDDEDFQGTVPGIKYDDDDEVWQEK